jgi:hypothetical protein
MHNFVSDQSGSGEASHVKTVQRVGAGCARDNMRFAGKGSIAATRNQCRIVNVQNGTFNRPDLWLEAANGLPLYS